MTTIPPSAPAPAVFDFHSHKVRIVIRDGAIWFVAADVCAALGYANPSKAVADHLDDDERSHEQLDRSRMGSKAVIINESGLYALVLRSRKPEARKFAKWVTSEVLPAIRKTGSYSTAPAFDPSASHTEAIQFAMDHIRALELHAADPASNPRPKWDEAEANRLADGVVSAWMLRNNRWLLSFDLNGKPQLTMVPRDACVMTPEKMLSAINDPNGLYIAPETLFRFAKATLSRLEHCHRYQKAKAEGGKVPLRW